VHIWRAGPELVCQVTDTGHISDPLAWYRAPAKEEFGGKGLWLVNQVCDLVQVRSGQSGTFTRLHMAC
jgi:hypothetical protein